MRLLNPHTSRVSHDFTGFSVSLEPGETIEVPEKYVPILRAMGSLLVPAPEPKPEPEPEPVPKPAKAAKPSK